MSRSQFQSTRFILTHAWLNLWDERMTTGRINQVAVILSILTICCGNFFHKPSSRHTTTNRSWQYRLSPTSPTPASSTTSTFLRAVSIRSHVKSRTELTLLTPPLRHNRCQLSVACLQKPHSTLPADKNTHNIHSHATCTPTPSQALYPVQWPRHHYYTQTKHSLGNAGPHASSCHCLTGQFSYNW